MADADAPRRPARTGGPSLHPAPVAPTPKRVQLRRSKGWRLPAGAVVVSRPSKWGNPFVVGDAVELRLSGTIHGPTAGEYNPHDPRGYDTGFELRLSADQAVMLYRFDLLDTLANPDPYYDTIRAALLELRGHDLACWCRLDRPCHADVLLEVANTRRPRWAA